MSLLDILTGGASGNATDAEKQALAYLQGVQTPTVQGLTLPQLQQYAVSQNMSPAQMQAFLQANNAYNTENIGQTGTAAQIAALNQLAGVANAGAAGTPVEQAQIAQALQQSNTNLAGQRGAIEQAAEARGVPPGLLAAALEQQNAGQSAMANNQAALQAQSQAYQTALNAMTQGANVGQGLQGQQNTQANTVAQAQNAMQQFNAANQQNAAAANAGYQQQANQYNTGMANTVGQANTGLANQRTMYNTALPETVFQNQMQKAQGLAEQENQLANTYTGQGQQQAGLISGLVGAGAKALNPGNSMAFAPASNMQGYSQLAGQGLASTPPGGSAQYAPQMSAGGYIEKYYKGGVTSPIPAHYDCGNCMSAGGLCMKHGGAVPGQAKVPGDSPKNDTVHAQLSPGEYVVPRSIVQNHPEDVATLLQALQHLRGKNHAV
jgi:hypothetical protein